MELVLLFATREEAEILHAQLEHASEVAHDASNDQEEKLFLDLADQINSQIQREL